MLWLYSCAAWSFYRLSILPVLAATIYNIIIQKFNKANKEAVGITYSKP
jgi:hypothetical protein